MLATVIHSTSESAKPYLHKGAASKTSSDNALGSLTDNVSTRSIHLGRILARKGTSSMGSPATIGINDDLSSS